MPRIAHQELTELVTQTFTKAGTPQAHAEIVSNHLVASNLAGHDSHGVMRIIQYVAAIGSGEIDPQARPSTLSDSPSGASLAGNRAFGQVAGYDCMSLAIEKAREMGVAAVTVSNCYHSGQIGTYAEQAAEAGMIGIHMGTSNPNMVYHGARVGGVATSPMAISVPRGDGKIISLDMATAIAGVGKLMAHKATNTPLGEGWALDGDGNPTTDPQKAEVPTPLGGPKGSGLSLMFECITSLMVGPSLIGRWVTGEAQVHKQNVVLVAVDIGAFIDLDDYKAEADYLVGALKDLPRADGVDEIFMPGERGDAMYEQRLRDGIPVPAKVWADIGKVAERFGVEMAETD